MTTPAPNPTPAAPSVRHEGEAMSNDHTPIGSPLDLCDGDRLEFKFQGRHHAGTYDQQQRMCDGLYIVLPAFRGWHIDITDVVRVEVSA